MSVQGGKCLQQRMKREEGTIVKNQEELELTLNTFFTNLLEEPDWDWYAA